MHGRANTYRHTGLPLLGTCLVVPYMYTHMHTDAHRCTGAHKRAQARTHIRAKAGLCWARACIVPHVCEFVCRAYCRTLRTGPSSSVLRLCSGRGGRSESHTHPRTQHSAHTHAHTRVLTRQCLSFALLQAWQGQYGWHSRAVWRMVGSHCCAALVPISTHQA